MKTKTIINLLIFSISISFSLNLLAKQNFATYAYPPYMNDSKEDKGFIIDFVNIILDDINLKHEISYYPPQRAIKKASEDPSIYLISSRHAIPRSLKHKFIYIRLFSYKVSLNGLKEKVEKIKSFNDLKGKTLISFRANDFARSFIKKYKMKPTWINDINVEVKLLKMGRGDFNLCLIENCDLMTRRLSKNSHKEFDFTSLIALKSFGEIILLKSKENIAFAKKVEISFRKNKTQNKLNKLLKEFKSRYISGVEIKPLLKEKTILDFIDKEQSNLELKLKHNKLFTKF